MSGDSDCTRTSPSAGSPSDNELLPDRPKYVCTLSPDLVTKAREELQEKPEWRLRDVQALRDMVCKDYPSLGTCLDDAFLLRFLRARKFDYDRALQLLVNYHTCRRTWPEVAWPHLPLMEIDNSGKMSVLYLAILMPSFTFFSSSLLTFRICCKAIPVCQVFHKGWEKNIQERSGKDPHFCGLGKGLIDVVSPP